MYRYDISKKIMELSVCSVCANKQTKVHMGLIIVFANRQINAHIPYVQIVIITIICISLKIFNSININRHLYLNIYYII